MQVKMVAFSSKNACWLLWQGFVPRPTVKKNRLSTFWGTLAGNCVLAELRSLLVKHVAKEMSLRAGRIGLKRGSFLIEGNEQRFSFKRFNVNSISFNNFKGVVCYAKEEFIIECSINYSEKVSFSRLYLQLECVRQHQFIKTSDKNCI
ncbi:hypothetical protein WN944_027960 [Citrus x changshan-huyou]|uniref:Uncharacterized protein n=1 Tax=Citrus x changshan-huyou TaxID=2935761 RepID=A0AAP0LPS7_9ROSI